MFDVFTEEIEVQIKKGISNLYWYLGDLKKAWLRSGVGESLTNTLFALRHPDGTKLSKRQLMDKLYEELRIKEYNKRLEVSRNFVRLLVEHSNFVPISDGHKIDIAESCALKLKQIIASQNIEQEKKQFARSNNQIDSSIKYQQDISAIKNDFLEAEKLEGQQRGYMFEKIFTALMKASGILVHDAFKIVGEQIDGAIKHDGHFYLVELKWTKSKAAHNEIASLYLKAEGKLEARGLFISMGGYSSEILQSLPKGKDLKILLMDGTHIAKVLFGVCTFKDILENAISNASLKGEIYS